MTELFPLDTSERSAAARVADLPAKAGTLHLWLIEPSATPVDSRWQDRAIWRLVVVAAPSATFARLVAEEWALPRPKPPIGNESDSPCAGFTDEKLYQVRPAPSDFEPKPVSTDWPGRVLVAHLLRDPPLLP